MSSYAETLSLILEGFKKNAMPFKMSDAKHKLDLQELRLIQYTVESRAIELID